MISIYLRGRGSVEILNSPSDRPRPRPSPDSLTARPALAHVALLSRRSTATGSLRCPATWSPWPHRAAATLWHGPIGSPATLRHGPTVSHAISSSSSDAAARLCRTAVLRAAPPGRRRGRHRICRSSRPRCGLCASGAGTSTSRVCRRRRRRSSGAGGRLGPVGPSGWADRRPSCGFRPPIHATARRRRRAQPQGGACGLQLPGHQRRAQGLHQRRAVHVIRAKKGAHLAQGL